MNNMLTNFVLTFCAMFFIISLTEGQKKAKTYCSRILPKRPRFHGIIGGTHTLEAEFPHMAALGYEDINNPKWLCGGTLISEQFVLTAGHCAETRSGPVLTVRFGTRSLKNPSIGYEDVNIETIVKHPGFKPPSQYNDIALLRLARNIIFSKHILPACLHISTSLTSKKLIATGWGKVAFAGATSDDLLKVSLKAVARNSCNKFFKRVGNQKLQRGIDNKLQICAGSDSNKEKDTCQGDSGGPLGYKQGKRHYIGGITSFGKACGLMGVPAVYTRVSSYVPWIESIVWR